VDLTDYTLYAINDGALSGQANWFLKSGSTGIAPSECDLNGDGTVDLTDYTSIAANFNQIGDN
jgi:hypothetical protein